MNRANKIFEEKSIFKGVAADAKKIKPLVTEKLDRKERQQEREMTSGKAWGNMAKVELTEELKADLRAL